MAVLLDGPLSPFFFAVRTGRHQIEGDVMGLGQSIARQVDEAARALLARDGYDLVLVEYVPQGHILRLYIDHADGITLEDCSRVSRLVGDVLDAESICDGPEGISSQYTLEVSSPGLDRPLIRPEHYRRFVGETVHVTVDAPLEGRKGNKQS
ncbi:MAG: ribosome maturation factor RimP [Deltaproteobacteria bacterium]|nr:MAG: ribosome maturation factor RimP [Deltaproteobacteria bacterium]